MTGADRSRALVAAPLVVAMLVASWLLWTRAEPERQGDFCANATIALASVLDSSSSGSNDVLSNPGPLLDAAVGLDVERLEVDPPPHLAPEVAVLRRDLPKYRREEATAAAAGEPSPPLPADLAAAFVLLVTGYLDECR